MAGVMTLLTIGALCGAVIMMKYKADMKFQTTMKTVFRIRIKKPFEMWYDTTAFAKWIRKGKVKL
jgi:hypothetical protein